MNTTQGMKRPARGLGALSLAALRGSRQPSRRWRAGRGDRHHRLPYRGAHMTSTSPVQVVSNEEIKHLADDMVDILIPLPQVFQNSATDFSNTSNSLSTPGGLTTVNLRGLVFSARWCWSTDVGSARRTPTPAIPTRRPIWTRSRWGDRARRRRHGGAPRYTVDAIAGRRQLHHAQEFRRRADRRAIRFNQHEQRHGFMQGWRRRGLKRRRRPWYRRRELQCVDLGGTNIADGRGNFTAYLTYRRRSDQRLDRDFAGCQLFTVLPDSSVCGAAATRTSSAPSPARPVHRGRRSIPPWPRTPHRRRVVQLDEFVNMSA